MSQKAKEVIERYAQDLIDVCPHCGAKVHIEKLWSDCHKYRNGDVEFYVLFRCKPCRKLLLKTYMFVQNRYKKTEELSPSGWRAKFPIVLDDDLTEEEKEYIPDDVLADYQEALKCKSIGAHRASCSMFRRSLQNALVILGANQNIDLIKQIASLESLSNDVKDWAHHVRILGNWGAHPDKDKLKEVAREDVVEAHDFMSKFLMYMFIMPKKVTHARARREKKAKPKQVARNDSHK